MTFDLEYPMQITKFKMDLEFSGHTSIFASRVILQGFDTEPKTDSKPNWTIPG